MKELNELNEQLNEKLEYYKQFSSNNFLKLFQKNSENEFENLVYESCYVYQLVFGQEGYLFGDKEETLFYQRPDCQMMFNFL
ncbi:hypothetical protein C7H19_23735 [Aphanothece hegewaldii CCALA 016]|uniref:Uncharacterized protein n=1 Tax=Aphanothece hegewaldii CCALA 016 TaxID=2107694 RepID=A0A2T1LR12_9CHRO|nr:hypothetical protein [Aphanothece hegewaldii]PSF30526.1 hypothetical protein C7H19_23735 [Aphanothece hegewaldii CCALA 016]